MKKIKVLIFVGTYLPGVKGGGPIQSVKNMVDSLSDIIDFYIITSDRDVNDFVPYANINTDTWIISNNSKIFYTDSKKLGLKKIRNIIKTINPDIIYLNSFFSYKFSISPILLKKMKKLDNIEIILAPRGEFSKGALNLKSLKKRIYLNFAKLFKLYKGITWHSTSKNENEDIINVFGENPVIKSAPNLTQNYSDIKYEKKIGKIPGELKIIYISRISPKKNLKKAIELLSKIKGKVTFNIYGPCEDKNYWKECKEIINDLPSNITVEYKGLVEHDQVIDLFKEHHIFLFPTLGENFGHVISEALIGGCPVIISDQTPWQNLEENGVGWDIPLSDKIAFNNAIQKCVDMNKNEYAVMSVNAFEYGKEKSTNVSFISQYEKLFEITEG